MAEEGEAAQVRGDMEASLSTSRLEDEVSLGNENYKALYDTLLPELPSHVVKDLMSNGVCLRCIFRLFVIQGHAHSVSSLSSSAFIFVQEPSNLENYRSEEIEVKPSVCKLCLGILQFMYSDGTGKLVESKVSDGLAISVAEMVKQEGHQTESFSLEVSVPPIIQENEKSMWIYLQQKYGSEPWFQGKSLSLCLSSKDALKICITKPLEALLGSKSSVSSFRIRLTYSYSNSSKISDTSMERNHGCKKRKTGTLSREKDVVEESSRSSVDNESSHCIGILLDEINKPCRLEILCYRTPIYFVGRYLKYSRNVSQTRWIIDDERMGEASVEEILGSNILPFCHGDNYKFHAAGREDIDVRMLGSGRPFLVEIQNARVVPSEIVVKEIETKINDLENKLVGVRNLKIVGNEGWALMREGELEKQKQYAALVWISRSLDDEDLHSISSLKDMIVLQRTPIRVLHRRSPLVREKIIHRMKIEKVAGSSQYFLLHLWTQAGTYVKEFVHGDLGRTHPSIGSILGCRAEILQLDVTDVKMDSFLPE